MKLLRVNLIIALIGSIATFLFLKGDSHAKIWGDDFSDGNLEGWTKIEGAGISTWQAKDGVLDVTIKPARVFRDEYMLELTAFPIKVTSFRVKCTILDGVGGSIGILMGKQPDRGSKWRLSYKFYTSRIEGPIVLPNKSPDIRFRIQKIDVVFDGGLFQLSSMEEQITEFRDDNFKMITLVGIAAVGGQGIPFHAVLDNFVISGPGIPKGPPYTVHPKGKIAVLWGELKKP